MLRPTLKASSGCKTSSSEDVNEKILLKRSSKFIAFTEYGTKKTQKINNFLKKSSVI